MTNKQKTGKITIANIIAIVGLVLLLIFSFIGHSYKSGGELGWDIIVSIGITAFTAFLIWFLIKAKGAENRLDLWRKVEYGTLAVYVVFAISTSFWGGIMHFFVVNDHKESIKEYANEDLDKIDRMINEYKTYEEAAITRTGTGLKSATGVNQICDETLNKFMEARGIHHTQESAMNYERIQRNDLIGEGYNTFYSNFCQKKNEIENVVKSWSVIQIPMKAKLISDLGKSVQEDLNKLSNNENLPVIESKYGQYTITSYQKSNFMVEGGIESFKFRTALQNTSGFSLTALLVVLLIHALILFNYIVAYRTSTLEISKHSEEDGGIILK